MGRYDQREFQCGDWFLGKRGNSPAWCRCRFNAATRQTERFSLGTTDIQEAEQKLVEWWIAHARKPLRETADVLLDEIVLAYYNQHAVNKPSGKRIKYQLGHVTGHFAGLTVKDACHPAEIEAFTSVMLGKGLKPTYVNNLLTVIKAAVNRAYKRREIAQVPFIGMLEAHSETTHGRPLQPAEIAHLLDNAVPHIQALIMLCLGTGCRPQAACELQWGQIDFDAGLIDLNPQGRQQTKKHRPVVKLPPTLRTWLLSHRKPAGLIVQYGDRSVRRYQTGWATAREGLPGQVTPYSLRHTVARWCRAQGVSPWEVANQLGHSVGARLSTTDRYAPHAPDYLAHACAAIDRLMQDVSACQKRASLALVA